MRFKRPTNGCSDDRSPKTMVLYRRTFGQLWRRFAGEHDGPQTQSAFVDWLILRKRSGDFAKRTWRVYRAAVVSQMEEGHPLRKRLEAESSDGARTGGTRRRTKHVSPLARERIRNEATKHCRPAERMADRLQAWIEAGEATGLRPGEWANATLIETPDGVDVLVVRNAKHYKDRAHGDSRQIALLSESVTAAVRRHLKFIAAYIEAKPGREFRHYYESCRKGLSRLNLSLPKSVPHLSLYSTRHQFKINAREEGVDRTELAYLMGHASTGTAQRHYGRARAGGSSFGVCADGVPDNPIRQTHRELMNALSDLSMPDSTDGLDGDVDMWSPQP